MLPIVLFAIGLQNNTATFARLMRTKEYILIICGLVFAGCGNHHHHEENTEEHHDEDHPMGVHFHKEWQDNLDFSTAKATELNMGTVIHTVAQVMPSVGDECIVAAKADGIVKLNNRSLTEGASIGAGQVVCTIDASSNAQNNLDVQQKQAQAEYQRAKAEYERLKTLREDKLVLESELQAAKAAYQSAEAEYNALRKNFGASGTQTVTATQSGFIKQIMVRNGEHVSAGTPIISITQSKTLQLKAEVQASYYSMLKDVCDATICRVDGGNADEERWTLQELGGKMVSYGKQTSAESPLIPVVFEINNVVDIVPGTFVDMYIKTRGEDKKLAAPSSSILEEMGNYFVYVQLEDEFFEKRQVKIGITDGIHTEVKGGLKSGEKVVTRGAILVKMQHNSGNMNAEHGHQH